MDFIRVAYKENKEGNREYYPSLQAIESQDLVVRGGKFAAVWDEDRGLYSRRQSHLPDIIDRSFTYMVGDRLRPGDTIKKVRVFDNQLYSRILSLINSIGDMGPDLDRKLVFANEKPTKADAATFVMPYALQNDKPESWDRLVSTLYTPEERLKIEWAIGSIFAGDSRSIQKFYVFYGAPGSGKSTIMNIIEKLFEGHTAEYSAYDMGRADAQFSLEPFSKNPLVGIDQDADLSRIEVNRVLNSVVSHDRVIINSKGRNLFSIRPRATLFAGTNDPVKMSNRKSGLFRRLIDIHPTGNLLDEDEYHRLMGAINFELGMIATHCTEVFKAYGPTYFSSYRATEMMYRTNDIFNFVQDTRVILARGVTLKQAHKLYSEWCEETDTRNVYKQYQLRDLLADYFEEFHDQVMVDGVRHRSYFTDLKEVEKFEYLSAKEDPLPEWLQLVEQESLMDSELSSMPAQQFTGNEEHPLAQPWSEVTTTLSDISTAQEHYVKVPEQHIVIDFDLKDEDGNKSIERNLDAAAHWPPTYAEVSRGGGGLHLHYSFSGDVTRLASGDDHGRYEVKSLLGNASLRRRLSVCNNVPVATISSGLPMKEEKVISKKTMSTERGLRELILRGLRKEVHQYTKPSMDFIKQVLDDADRQGMDYDVSDMWDDILAFAMSSSNQRGRCLEVAMKLKLKSEAEIEAVPANDGPLVDFDLEVYPNAFLIGYLPDGGSEVAVMVNPTPAEVEELLKMKLVGFFNRMYDNHILWAATLGYSNEQLFNLSQRIVTHRDKNAYFGAAFNATFADVYDICSEKKSLKKWEIDLGLPHMEMDIPWDEPVPEDRMQDVIEYMKNDVLSTAAVRKHREQDFRAREILAELSGLQVMNTNKQHTERLVFGDVKDPSADLVYTDLTEMFPGYEFNQFAPGKEKSTYKGVSVGEGGLVRAKPGYYENVALLDVASMHPTSIVELNMFGQYTGNFKRLLDIRLAIKNKNYDTAIDLDGRLKPYLENTESAKALSDALKIVINSVYGLTAAKFDNKFRDSRNLDNIVAKRGALFMVDLEELLNERGFDVVHIKTDSVKIANPTPEIIEEVMRFGEKYGYTFEHEATYEKFCLFNDAVYIAREKGHWSATGAQFQHPVVFKTLLTGEEPSSKDYVEVKQTVKGSMYLVAPETEEKQFVGRFGAFLPVIEGRELLRIDGEKVAAVANTKGYLWELDEVVFANDLPLDMNYYQELIAEGRRAIEQWVPFNKLLE